MMERNTQKHNCLYLYYDRYCVRTYFKDIRKLGWADITEYRCKGKCEHYKRKTLLNQFIFWLFR